MLYTSKDNAKIKEIRKLLTKKYRDETNLFLVEGKHLVEEAYKAHALETLILLEGESLEFPVEKMVVTNQVMKSLSDMDSTARMIGVCKKKEPTKEYGNRILILDDIQDPGNLGTIVRTAVAFHVDTIIRSKNTVDLYNPKVIRSSQGMLFSLNVVTADLEEAIKNLKQENYQIIGTKVDGGTALKNFQPTEKYALIMGNEGNGMHEEISSLCDLFLYIDMNKSCESLNVGVATGIILYELDV